MKKKIIIMMMENDTATRLKLNLPDEDLAADLKRICYGDLLNIIDYIGKPEELRKIAARLKNIKKRIDSIINDIKGTYEAKALEIELHDKTLEKMSKESLIAYIKDLERKQSASA